MKKVQVFMAKLLGNTGTPDKINAYVKRQNQILFTTY